MKLRKKGDYVDQQQLTPSQLNKFKQDCYVCGARAGYFIRFPDADLCRYMKWDGINQVDVYHNISKSNCRDVTNEYKESNTQKIYIKDRFTGFYLKCSHTYTENKEEAIEFSQKPTSVLVEYLEGEHFPIVVTVREETIQTEKEIGI